MVDFKLLSEFIAANGLQTLEIIAVGWFAFTRVWPFFAQQTQRWMELQQKRVDTSAERDERMITALERNTAAIQALDQLIGAQHDEILRRLDLLGGRDPNAK